ncbi:hypothetical protein V8F06_009603 [Rhypophila decipiens]
MSVEIWPPISPQQLKDALATSQKRELDWLVDELRETLTNLKHGLEDCYALLAPVDPGSTLVLSTPRNEIVKGHITRVGTRIVKGTIHLRLRTVPHQTLTINPDHPIHLGALASLHTLINHSIDLLNLTLSYSYPSGEATPSSSETSSPQFLAAQLRLLSQSISEASSYLKGPPLTTADPSWTTRSVAPSHFTPPLGSQPQTTHHNILGQATTSSNNDKNPQHPPPLSFYISLQDSCIVLWLRSLEAADAPVHFGTKLALAIGTARRLEHDESDRIFGFCCRYDETGAHLPRRPSVITSTTETGIPLSGKREPRPASIKSQNNGKGATHGDEVDVYVREKVRVETADPSLLSLASKLSALGHTLAHARRNLAIVMGEYTGEDGTCGGLPGED